MAMADLTKFTLGEQLLIIEDAEKLIATPDTWVQGEWECVLYETDSHGDLKRDARGFSIPKCDAKGNQLYGYCIEGAINKAILDRFGDARARAVGVFDGEDGYSEDGIDGRRPTAILSVNETADALFGMDAQYVNDRDAGEELENDGIYISYHQGDGGVSPSKFDKLMRERRLSIHADVLSILRTKKAELRRRLRLPKIR